MNGWVQLHSHPPYSHHILDINAIAPRPSGHTRNSMLGSVGLSFDPAQLFFKTLDNTVKHSVQKVVAANNLVQCLDLKIFTLQVILHAFNPAHSTCSSPGKRMQRLSIKLYRIAMPFI